MSSDYCGAANDDDVDYVDVDDNDGDANDGDGDGDDDDDGDADNGDDKTDQLNFDQQLHFLSMSQLLPRHVGFLILNMHDHEYHDHDEFDDHGDHDHE